MRFGKLNFVRVDLNQEEIQSRSQKISNQKL